MATSDASSDGEAKVESSSIKKISRLSMAAQVPPIRDGAALTHAEWEVHSTTVELDVSSRTNRDALTHNESEVHSTTSELEVSSRTKREVRQGTKKGRHPRSLQGQEGNQLRTVCKPWHGPVPPARLSPKVSLGDVWVRDLRAGRRGSAVRLKQLGGDDGMTPCSRLPAWEKKWGGKEKKSQLEFQIPVSTRIPVGWAGLGHQCTRQTFRFTSGLGVLLKHAGRPVGLFPRELAREAPLGFPSPKPKTPPPSHRRTKALPVMAGRQWDERGFRAEREYMEREVSTEIGRPGRITIRAFDFSTGVREEKGRKWVLVTTGALMVGTMAAREEAERLCVAGVRSVAAMAEETGGLGAGLGNRQDRATGLMILSKGWIIQRRRRLMR